MREILFNLIPTLLSFLYKNKCVCCHCFSGFSVCNKCLNKIDYNNFEHIRKIDNIEIYSIANYSGPIKKMICGFKFNKRKDVAYILTKLIYNYWAKTDLINKQFQVVPIPVHKSKKLIRGFDQSYIIAKNFSFITGYKFAPELLKRIKKTRPQYNLKAEERKENLKNAFEANINTYQNLPILLIDDICTTGSTIQEAIRALKKKGHNDITVLTISSIEFEEKSFLKEFNNP